MKHDLPSCIGLLLFRLYPPLVLYLQELPEGPSPLATCRLIALLLPPCGFIAMILGYGRLRHQLSIEAMGLLTLVFVHTQLSLIGFCLAQIGLLVLFVPRSTIGLYR